MGDASRQRTISFVESKGHDIDDAIIDRSASDCVRFICFDLCLSLYINVKFQQAQKNETKNKKKKSKKHNYR